MLTVGKILEDKIFEVCHLQYSLKFSRLKIFAVFAGYRYIDHENFIPRKFSTCCIRTYALYGTRARPRKFYPRKFVSEQNLAKPRTSKILGYTVSAKTAKILVLENF